MKKLFYYKTFFEVEGGQWDTSTYWSSIFDNILQIVTKKREALLICVKCIERHELLYMKL